MMRMYDTHGSAICVLGALLPSTPVFAQDEAEVRERPVALTASTTMAAILLAALAACSSPTSPSDAGRTDAGPDAALDAGRAPDTRNTPSDADRPDGDVRLVDTADAGDTGPTFERTVLDPLDGPLVNPERGFYRAVSLLDEEDLSWVREADRTLVFSYVRLDDYRTADLPQSLLSDVDAALDVVRAAGLKLILRFAYNFGPYPDSEPDAPLDRVLRHIEQLQPIVQANEDVVMVLQAGFIGAWGEWHTSTNDLTTEQNRETILRALLDAVPDSRMVQIRYPSAKVDVFGPEPLSTADAFDGTDRARTGHHNDCFLSSETDVGTYGRGDLTMAEELAYLRTETRYLPMGGETCAVFPARSGCDNAVEEMRSLHFTYVNEDYHPDVVASWADQGCFDEIRDYMGPRLRLQWIETPTAVTAGGELAVRLSMTNDGFAAPFNERPARLVLRNGTSVETAPLAELDVRRVLPGEPVEVEHRWQLPADLPPGNWELGIWLPDASPTLQERPDYAVRLANTTPWDAATGVNFVAEIELR